MKTDSEIIDALGGTAKVAKLLGYDTQRVHNWRSRGIPSKVKVERPDLFMPNAVTTPEPTTAREG